MVTSNKNEQARHACSGFTVMELAISVIVATLAVGVALAVGMTMSGQMRGERSRMDSQNNARIAMDEITRILRGTGSQIDFSRGQKTFVHAGPYTVAVNANLFPMDDATGTQAPLAVNPAFADATVPLGDGESYTPVDAYGTGAETIVISIDSSRDGLVSTVDAADDEEEDSENPRDFVVKTFIYGSDGAANTVSENALALIRGPITAPDGSQPPPLFQYWIDADNDRDTPPVLYGDADNDGSLSASEVAALTPVPQMALGLIEKVDITATAETSSGDRSGEFKQTSMQSSVTFRNRNFSAARILGIVFHDVDEDGAPDPGEVPLAGVAVRCSNGSQTRTDASGKYWFVLPPGTYTVQEIDPVGVTSTTPNSVPVEAAPGDYVHVNFGDKFASGRGSIRGQVYEDANANGLRDGGEAGIGGVAVFLDTGATARTDSLGRFLFWVGVGNYTVAETDLDGYMSTTPNIVDVNIAADGDSALVQYGDRNAADAGQIAGVVYLDENNNGQRDVGELGLPNVTVSVDDSDYTVTDKNGEFRFTVEPGTHLVTEFDPPVHTSSTANTVTVTVATGETVNVSFGDIGQEDVTFQEIALANTERALSITTAEFHEDNRSDLDIILGTHYVNSGNDLLVWWNQRINSGTPNSSIFAFSPTLQRSVTYDVNTLAAGDLNNDGYDDVISGLGSSSSNIAVWLTQSSGANQGKLNNAPQAWYSASGAIAVFDVVLGRFNADAYTDLAVGTKTGSGTGRVEIWLGSGGGSFEQTAVYSALANINPIGEVMALAVADFTGDGIDDLVVGTETSSNNGRVFLCTNNGSGKFTAVTTIPHASPVQDLLALDMMEDDRHDIDIVVATVSGDHTGGIHVWHNRGDNNFGIASGINREPNDFADPGGAPLSLITTHVDNDVFPDIIVGTRTNDTYGGAVVVYRAFGFLPSQGLTISNSQVGEVITITVGDFNKDGAPDLAAGTRVSGSTGKVVIYFNTLAAI